MFCLMSMMVCAASVQPPAEYQMPFVARNADEARAWQEKVRTRLLEIVAAQNPRRDTPLDIRVEGERTGPGYRVSDLTFTSNEGARIESTLTIPEGAGAGPFPAVVCLHGHGGSREKVHDASTEYKGFASEFARRGFVTLSPTLAHCDYAPNQLWNLMRVVDAVQAQPTVDPARVGVAGLSMGGEWTMWLAACDPRVRAAVVSGWMCTTEGVLRVPNCPCWMPPGLLELCDICEVHILIAPRPLLFESAQEDPCFPVDATRLGYSKVLEGYRALGAADRVRQHTFPGGHQWNGAEAYAFMEAALKPAAQTTEPPTR